MRSDRDRLLDIVEAIERIERHTNCGREAFASDELVQTWVIHHIQIIGEAARTVSETLRAAHPEIPWRQIVAMRHILVHTYFGVKADEVWVAVETDLPDLKKKVKVVLEQLGDEK